ncbi:MAG: 6-hydroxymethylpterin diphosphokinase MptE-like protein [Spirochaetales bacterium]
MNWLEVNLAVLEGRFSGISKEILSQIAPIERPEFLDAKSGARTARWKGLTWASTFDPAAEARKTLPVLTAETDFAVVGGFGMGYWAEALREEHPDLPVVVAEPDPWWLGQVLAQRDLRSLLADPFVSFVLGGSPQQIGDYLGRFVCRNIAWLPHRPTFALHSVWMNGLEAALADFQALSRVNRATLDRFAGLWLRNFARNEALWDSPLSAPIAVGRLAGLAPGSRVVIAAAGPSLGGSLDWLKRHRSQVLLIAVDTSWNTLKQAGLVPDFVVIMDGQYWNARHVDPPVEAPTRIVCEGVSHPSTLRLAPERTYVAATSVPLLRSREERVWGELGTLRSGGSVATTAWSLALLLGATEVVFCGLDLGYPKGGSHVQGSQFEERKHRLARRLQPAETWGHSWLGEPGLVQRLATTGGQILSDPRMDLYRSWLALSVAEHPEVTAWNLSPIGSRVPGLSTPPARLGEDWPQQPVPRWPEGPRLVSRSEVPDATSLPLPLAFPAEMGRAWVEAWELRGQRLWGQGWELVAGPALRTWKLFPSARSLRALRESWDLEQTLESQIFRSSPAGAVRS